MNLKAEICKAFCDGVSVSEFAGGFGISTQYIRETGDPLSFYVLGPSDAGTFKIVDDALTVADFESQGATLESQTRRESFFSILDGHGAEYDEDFGELYIAGVIPGGLPSACIEFMFMLLRLEDMRLMSRERIKNTFSDDIEADLLKAAGDHVSVSTGQPASEETREIIPDFVLRAKDHRSPPVALFVVTNDNKLWQAIHLRMVANYEVRDPLSVIAILESESSASQEVRRKADNRLDAVPRYRQDERAAIEKIMREARGARVH